ncbi:MAG: hypothetical protein KGM44_11450 [bacterium]|nr:hypothetical protein [bacterium]
MHAHGTMAYYEGLDENRTIPASWMAAHYDFTEQSAYGGRHAKAFLAAGGTYAIAYTDPNLIPFCKAPFTRANGEAPGACGGPMGSQLQSDESAWLHDSGGGRLHVISDGPRKQGSWQERTNPMSATLRSVYRSYTAGIADAGANAFLIDDADPAYDTTYFHYKFGTLSKELEALGGDADPSWLNGQAALAAAAVRPVFYNGGGAKALNLAFLAKPNVAGRMIENCASYPSYWAGNMDALLYTTETQRYAICLNYGRTGTNAPADRIFDLASWYLTYDPKYSVIFNDLGAFSDGTTTYPEFAVAPTQPLTTARDAAIATLRSSTGIYVREFASCYQAGTSIGPCAALVNPDSKPHPLPALHDRYARRLTLDARSWYSGGAADWSSNIPAQLGPYSALILRG